jgi:beta-lactamase class A
MVTRRAIVVGAAGLALAASGRKATAAAGWTEGLGAAFAGLEQQGGGRLGVAVLDTATGARASHRGDERFPMCSTFKLLGAAAVLARVDAGQEMLDRRVRYGAGDLVAYSPTTKNHVADGMTMAEICRAALTQSDNTAGNLILASLGGPAGLTAFARSLGDEVTRLDRNETTLNEATPGDPRDTTSPNAMAGNLQTLVLGSRLSESSRGQLQAWLVANETGGARLRAGLPAGWRVGDKTGTGDNGTNNDVAVIWPPSRAPLIVCAYLTESKAGFEEQNKVVAGVGAAVARALSA